MGEHNERPLRHRTVPLVALLTTCAWGSASGANMSADSPIMAKLARGNGFATFTNRRHPDNRIGYRFHEHTPIVHGQVPDDNERAGIDPAEMAELERRFGKRPGVLKNELRVDDKGWVPQQWTFYMAPVADGIDLLLVVQTDQAGLNAYYGIQQCFRMSGTTNAAWRRTIAQTPAFSEYDLWRRHEKDKPAKTSLTYVLRKRTWQALPATSSPVGARTPLGVRVDTERSGGDLAAMLTVGPYKARMLEQIDNGLVTRTNRERTWVCGIYWQRTSHVSDHHPADCLHSIVNVGPIPPNAKRAVRGKIYWFAGTLNELRKRWRRDFPDGPAPVAAPDK